MQTKYFMYQLCSSNAALSVIFRIYYVGVGSVSNQGQLQAEPLYGYPATGVNSTKIL